MDEEHKYDDIIELNHHISKKHKQMSIENRSLQFAAFAALTGYEDVINESGRITEKKIEFDDEVKNNINSKIQFIKCNIEKAPKVNITYFIKDNKKNGGKYHRIIGNVKKIDEYNKLIYLMDKTIIPIEDISEIIL